MLDAFDLTGLSSSARSPAFAFDPAPLPPARRLLQMVDELDYGILLLNDDGQVCQANRAARRELDDSHPLQLHGNELRPRHAHDLLPLRDALTSAAQRGLRRLLCLGDDELRVTLAVVPLAALPGEAGRCVMLVLGKRQICEELTVEWFARAYGLTLAETAVVKGLCADLTPNEIAVRQGVGLATIRTQIGSIRAKTRSPSIRALVRQVAMLPPLVSALQGLAPLPVPARARPAAGARTAEPRTALAA
ncbi:helix-turn-helix transcriptional regulator [Aquabacterium humicola]|uniref:helix-turn-helix transcriptional regulator n=1 Tax=Aquabacterium humicola TaxID=3237377 RepID=UPI0025430D63|nr:helix-turn-helix transcriptional regulator [Rubrivivax pictus]